jgi:hypothetical protein
VLTPLAFSGEPNVNEALRWWPPGGVDAVDRSAIGRGSADADSLRGTRAASGPALAPSGRVTALARGLHGGRAATAALCGLLLAASVAGLGQAVEAAASGLPVATTCSSSAAATGEVDAMWLS